MTGFHAYAASRARALGVEAACNARHTALQRLAKWIARLHAADGEERGISITQGELADMLGVQRTSVNAACRHLQDRGALRICRARLIVLDQGSFRRRPAIATSHWRTALRNGASAIG